MRLTKRLPAPSLRTFALVMAVLGIFLLSQFATTGAQGLQPNWTIPAYGLLTQLRGPVTLVEDDKLAICGVEVQIVEGTTRIDQRVSSLTDPGAWARVLASYGEDQLLYAVRIKTIEPQPFPRVRGTLLNETPSDSFPRILTVDGIDVTDDGTARRAGHIVVGERVDIKANTDDCDDGKLTATQIVGKASPPGHDKPSLTTFVGTVQNELVPPDLLGEWMVDDHAVEVNAGTVIDTSKGDAKKGAKVKVVAEVQPNDSLVAVDITVLPGKGPKGPK